MQSPKDKPYKCYECGERFTLPHSTRFGEDLGTDSASHHQKVTGHCQQRNSARAEYVDFTVAGQKSGRLTASQQDRATGRYFARCACGRMMSIAQDQWRSAEHCHAEYETVAEGPDTRLFVVGLRRRCPVDRHQRPEHRLTRGGHRSALTAGEETQTRLSKV